MRTIICCSAVAAVMVVAAACGVSDPTWPASPPEVGRPSAPPPASPSPPDSVPHSTTTRTFVFDHELSYRVTAYTMQSRIVLNDRGTFVLQYEGFGEYPGTYIEADGVVEFDFDGWSLAGPWTATGTIEGNLLAIRYSWAMSLSDFEDAVYTLVQ